MKVNKIHRDGRRKTIVGIVILALILLGTGTYFGYDKLREIYLEQCVIRQLEDQVTIESGKMVKGDVIGELFGFKPGANLALIDYEAKRKLTLEKIPNLRELKVRRFLPDRVSISIEERVPIARLTMMNRKNDTFKVTDSEGVVFMCATGTKLLPQIREATTTGTAVGHHLDARALAAVHLVDACRDPAFQELNIQDIDTSHPDYIEGIVYAGISYAKLKIAWENMDAPETPASRASLVRQLTHLRDAIRSNIGIGTIIWNATDFSHPGRIYADTKGKL